MDNPSSALSFFISSPRPRSASTPFLRINTSSPSSSLRPRALSQTHSPLAESFYFSRSENLAHSIPSAPSPITVELLRQIASIDETLRIVATEEHEDLRNHIEGLQEVNQRFFELQSVLPSQVRAANHTGRSARIQIPPRAQSLSFEEHRPRRESTSSISESSNEENSREAETFFPMDYP